MKKIEKKKISWIREMYKDSSEEVIQEAEDNFRAYIDCVIRIYEGYEERQRLKSDPLTDEKEQGSVKIYKKNK